jgi:hypothetical protein
LDVYVRPLGGGFSVSNEAAGYAAVISRLQPLRTKRIVLEATGGYERALWLALNEAGLVAAVVNPRQVRGEGGWDKPQCASIPRPGGRNHLARTGRAGAEYCWGRFPSAKDRSVPVPSTSRVAKGDQPEHERRLHPQEVCKPV